MTRASFGLLLGLLSLVFFNMHGSTVHAQTLANSQVVTATKSNNHSSKAAQLQNAAFGEIVYHYFQENYQQVLKLIAVGKAQHGFVRLKQANTDRLKLMQGASQMQLGLYQSSQDIFAALLAQKTSDYVQANTWFFMAKAGFENKQAYLSEQAYTAIVNQQLKDELTQQQWHELLYLSAYTRMQLGQDWQSLYAEFPTNSIYKAYLLANDATNMFNNAEYETAIDTFLEAKQALSDFKNSTALLGKLIQGMYDSVKSITYPFSSFKESFDSNSATQQSLELRTQQKLINEQDALFDRINMGLGQSLLQTGELGHAMAVLQSVAQTSAEAEQAMLSYAWANARENRWQAAMAAWRYLQQNSIGAFALQANYGLAYAYNQQDQLGRAFYALQNTAQQIDNSLFDLNAFLLQITDPDFFSQFDKIWPESLKDLKLLFLETQADFDARHVLSMREQAKAALGEIVRKKQTIKQLTLLLQERETAHQARLQNMDLLAMQQSIDQAEVTLNMIKAKIENANSFEQELALGKQMAGADTSAQLARLQNAKSRHKRLANDGERKRPLKPSYAERLARIEGILIWQMMDSFVADKWQHQALLRPAQAALDAAKMQLSSLNALSQEQATFKQQRERISLLNQAMNEQTNAARLVYDNATSTLQQALQEIINTRISLLEQQGVNTRLAMLRIQDLRQGEE